MMVFFGAAHVGVESVSLLSVLSKERAFATCAEEEPGIHDAVQ